MKASIVDLRYRMSEVLGALSRRERVQILYHGKACEHPFFGMLAADREPVAEVMDRLRGGRHRDL